MMSETGRGFKSCAAGYRRMQASSWLSSTTILYLRVDKYETESNMATLTWRESEHTMKVLSTGNESL